MERRERTCSRLALWKQGPAHKPTTRCGFKTVVPVDEHVSGVCAQQGIDVSWSLYVVHMVREEIWSNGVEESLHADSHRRRARPQRQSTFLSRYTVFSNLGDVFSTWRSALVESLTFRSALRARFLALPARSGHSHDQPINGRTHHLPGSVRPSSLRLCATSMSLWKCEKPPTEVLRKAAPTAVRDSKSDPRLHGAIW